MKTLKTRVATMLSCIVLILVATISTPVLAAAAAEPIEVSVSYLNGKTFCPLTPKEVVGTMSGSGLKAPVNAPNGYTVTKISVVEYAEGGRMLSMRSVDFKDNIPTSFTLLRAGEETNLYMGESMEWFGKITGHTVWLAVWCEPNAVPEPEPSKHVLTVKCYLTGEVNPFLQYQEEYAAGEQYNLAVEGLAGYTPDRECITGVMPDGDHEERVTYTRSKVTLTIRLFEQGKEAPFEVLSFEHDASEEYSHALPAHAGYKLGDVPEGADYGVVDGALCGKMPNANRTVDVTYVAVPKEKYTLMVEYYINGQTEPVEVYSESVIEGEDYSVKTPDRTHYVADKAVVAGTMPNHDISERVTYSPAMCSLTINCYKSVIGGEPFKVIKKEVAYGDTYDVELEVIDGYTIETYADAHIVGVMNATSKVLNVVYQPKDTTKHTLRVEFYGVEDGNKTLWNVIEEHHALNDVYEIDVPTVVGYSPNRTGISGSMPDTDLTIEVVYTRNVRPGGPTADEDEGEFQPEA